MALTIQLLLYGLLFLGVLFAIQGMLSLLRTATSSSRKRIERRLDFQSLIQAEDGTSISAFRADNMAGSETAPNLIRRLRRFIEQAGLKTTPERLLTIGGVASVAALLLFRIVTPFVPLPLALVAAPIAGYAPLFLYVAAKRKQRLAKFEEQLTDAIDLLVRSLRVGQALTAAVHTVAKECQEPIASEFQLAYEKAAFGRSLPSAFADLAERVPVNDLRYLAVAVQINHEAGGNLAEVLAGMSNIIRDRIRMFRKIKALTAEGRFSAWFLSLFPIGLYFLIKLVKPDYFSAVMASQYFIPGLTLIVFMLLVNVGVMRIITTIKV